MVKQLFSINNFLVVLIFFCTGLTIVVAQETDTEIRIKIEKDIDGEKHIIDKTFTDPNDPELKELLKDNDVKIKSKDIDVDVEMEENDSGKSFNIDLDTDDPESVEQFKEQVQQLADDMGIDIDINKTDNKQLRMFKYMPGDEDFDMNKLFDNLDEDVKQWIDIEELKENLDHKLKDWDIDVDGLYNSKRPMMGVTIKDVEEGVLIENVSDEMGAKDAGLETGDVIKSIDGEKMENVDQIIDYIADKEAGDFVEVKYERGGKTKNASVELKASSRFNSQIFKFDDNNIKKFKFDSDDFDLNQMDKWIEENVENIDGKETKTRVMVMISDLDAGDEEKLNSFSPNAKLSVIDKADIGSLEFFPNPSKGIFNLKFDSEDAVDTQINIYDMNGKEVYSKFVENFEGTFDEDIDISGSEEGAYILEIVKDNKRFNKKVIIE